MKGYIMIGLIIVGLGLGILGGVIVAALTWKGPWTTLWLVGAQLLIWAAGFVCIRLLIFDVFLNVFRREKLDYMSTETNDYEDQHTTHLTFWDKRILAVAGWFVCWITYYLIFHKK